MPSMDQLLTLFKMGFVGALGDAMRYVANIASSLSLDPSYFLEGAKALAALNLGLAFLKALASYGLKAVVVINALYKFLADNSGSGWQEEAIVQVHECVAPPERAAEDALLARLELERRSLSIKHILSLSGKGLDDANMVTIARMIQSGALASLQVLYLSSNQIGDGGMKEFSAALSSGALPNLQTLGLDGNQISDEGMAAFSDTIASGSMGAMGKLTV